MSLYYCSALPAHSVQWLQSAQACFILITLRINGSLWKEDVKSPSK